ncbi:MAG: hypothetical protein IKK05_01155, partial [Alistipes sp.]|nr:hypothetical protein [Alistipes sp.]
DKYEPVQFEVRLIPDRKYQFVVFADFVDQTTGAALRHQIGETLNEITLINEPDKELNYEVADCYFKSWEFSPKDNTQNQTEATLTRPYAKVRVIATDLNELNLNVHPENVTIEYYDAVIPTAFNAVTGSISVDNTTKTFSYNYIDKVRDNMAKHVYNAGYDAKVDTKTGRATHMTLFTDYILAKDEQSTIHFKMTVSDKIDAIKVVDFNTEIPIQRNYLTTVIGNVLTTNTKVDITINDNFTNGTEWNPDKDEFDIAVWDGKSAKEPTKDTEGNYIIKLPSELAWLADQVNGVTRAAGRDFAGETFKLTQDIDLGGEPWTPIGATGKFLGTFDGQNHIVANLVVSEDDKTSVGLFANGRVIKNIKVVNADIRGHYKAGVIVGDGLCAQIENCHVENAKVVVTPINNDDANNVGGIVGYLSAEPTAYVKNCSVKNAEITAYRKVAGIVGAANNAAEVSGNIVENVTVTADQTAEYKEFKATEAGAIVGYKHANVKFENNTEGENVVVIRKVNSNEELKAAMGVVNEGDIVEVSAGTYSKFVAPAAKITVKCENGTKFVGLNKLNIKGSTVEGATFTCDWQNGSYEAVDQTINGFFKNCLFVSWNALRMCYAGETCVFEDCYFKGGNYAVHFDGGDYNITFRRCHLSGFNAFAAKVPELTFDECTFYYATDGMWDATHNGVNLWGKTNLINTTFVFDGQAQVEWIGLNGATEAGNEITLKGCKVVDGEGNELPMFKYFANYDEGDKVTIEDEVYTLGDGSIEDAEGNVTAYTEAGLKDALENGGTVILANPFTIDQSESNGYGKTGINMTNGGTLDGNGNELGAPGSTGTWDSAINTSGGTIKNLKVSKGFRGIFIKKDANHNEKLYLDNVTIDGTTYTISCDQGSNSGLEATNSTFKGWTSYAATLGDAKFTDCYFGYGNGYSFCRPYAPTEFVGCEFEAGITLDPRAAVTLENCTYDGVAVTAENLSEFVPSSKVANVTIK